MTQMEKLRIIELRAAGVSYGDIAAQTGIAIGTVRSTCRRAAVADAKKCPQCGTMLAKPHNTRRFCSDSCRRAWHRTRGTSTAVCANCGETFCNNYVSARKYCSRKCYFAAQFGGAAT